MVVGMDGGDLGWVASKGEGRERESPERGRC